MTTVKRSAWRAWYGVFAWVWVLGVWPAVGQAVAPVQLPGDYADFALHTETGDLVALDPVANQAVRFRRAALERGEAEPAGTVGVGLTPISVCYKRFGDQAVYAVACTRQAKLYVIDAESFELVNQIETGILGATQVLASQNPEDPFIYVCYGSGHDSAAGALDLRDLSFEPSVVDDTMDAAVSPDGRVFYRRGPFSPSGFEALQLTGGFGGDRPRFGRAFYDHRTTPAYLPGPHGLFCVSGDKVYSRLLNREVAALPFVPGAFFRDRPVILGVGSKTAGRNAQRRTAVTLRAVSYNSFENVGEAVEFDYATPAGNAALPRGIAGNADFKRVGMRERLFADDARGSAVYAYRRHAAVIPLARFGLPDEPVLVATLEGADALTAGSPATLTVRVPDPSIEVSITDKPVGVSVEGASLAWTPGDSDVGPTQLGVLLRHGQTERTQVFELDVRYPSIALPFEAGGLSVDTANNRAAVWQVPAGDRRRPAVPEQGQTFGFAVIDLTTGEVLSQRRLAIPLVQCLLAGDDVLIWDPAGQPKIEALDRGTLERKRTLRTSGPAVGGWAMGAYVVVQTPGSIEVFEQGSLDRVKTYDLQSPLRQALPSVARRMGNALPTVTSMGLLLGHNLLDEGLNPVWLGDTLGLDVIPSATPYTAQTRPPDALVLSEAHLALRKLRGPERMERLFWMDVPGREALAGVERQDSTVSVPGATHTWQNAKLLYASLSTTAGWRQQLLERQATYLRQDASQPPSAALAALPDRSAIVYGDRLYQWPYPKPDPTNDDNAPLAWVPQQSVVTLSPGRTTRLRHTFTGGNPPLRYLPHMSVDGVVLDPKTGVIEIDNDKLRRHALSQLTTRYGSALQRHIERNQTLWDLAFTTLMGRKPDGVPMALRIQIEASDQDLQTQVAWYHLIVEVPVASALRPTTARVPAPPLPQNAVPNEGDPPPQRDPTSRLSDAAQTPPSVAPPTNAELDQTLANMGMQIKLLMVVSGVLLVLIGVCIVGMILLFARQTPRREDDVYGRDLR